MDGQPLSFLLDMVCASISVVPQELINWEKSKVVLMDVNGGRKERDLAQVKLTMGTDIYPTCGPSSKIRCVRDRNICS